ncbi:hypothetical protein AVEN_15227-1 [Araneus ventricosus]|uniref:Uncharacterized protein n=1 Tax=Araneus ventricosus TaxID=182803 RepID=A0A4Y2RTS5_ARAVE|nr:hypothetical protein AVEN_15227-1 [Araneus ventricosus]
MFRFRDFLFNIDFSFPWQILLPEICTERRAGQQGSCFGLNETVLSAFQQKNVAENREHLCKSKRKRMKYWEDEQPANQILSRDDKENVARETENKREKMERKLC